MRSLVAPNDPEFKRVVAAVLVRGEQFFLGCVETGQADGTITRSVAASILAQHLLGVLLGIRILARACPERALLEGVASGAFALLDRV